MRIGIITICKVNNYGADLQAFALQKKLELMGYDSEIIDYLYYKNWRFKDSKKSAPLHRLSQKSAFLFFFKYRIANFIIDKILPMLNRKAKNRNERFHIFETSLSKFGKEYSSIDELYSSPPDYDIYIVGSDQVWNPNSSSSIEPYFLDFVPQNRPRMSYASSFGVSSIDTDIQDKLKEWLNQLNTISVREADGVRIVKELTGRDANLVLDPTLLLDEKEWMQFFKPYCGLPDHYILIYQLSENAKIVELSKKIAKHYNWSIVRVCKRAFKVERNNGIINVLDAGPSEFLQIVHNANFVITNSFHGTAFALNFQKPFYTVVSSKKKNNSRMESLLKSVGMSDRMIRDNIDVESLDVTKYPDFKLGHKKLKDLRQLSVSFLENNLKSHNI